MRTPARTVSILGIICSMGFVAALHFVRPDLPPTAHRLSEYANGPFGWMMTMSFLALGCALVALGVVLRGGGRRQDMTSWAASTLAFLAGTGLIVSGLFRTGASTTEEAIHSPASALAVAAVVSLALIHSSPTMRRRTGRKPDEIGAGLALVALVLAALGPFFHHTQWTGLSQRMLWIMLLAWLLRAAWRHPLDGSFDVPAPR